MNKQLKHTLASALFAIFIFSSFQLTGQEWIQMMDAGENFHAIQDAFNQKWAGKTYEKGKGYKQFKRWENFMEERTYPTGEFMNPKIVWDEWANFQNLYGGNQLEKNGTWTPIGPSNWVNGPGWNAGNGRINVVVEDPNNTNTIYVGAASGGLWKSTNGGTTWASLTDNQPVLGVSGIAIDPNNSNTIYIGTGDGDGWNTYSVGVLKSTDGGTTWNTTGLNWNIYQVRVIRKLTIDPNDPNVLFAATSAGLYRTTDAGVTWNLVQGGSMQDVEIHPTNSTIVYACSDRFYRSTNSGATFTEISAGLPAAANINRYKIAVSPNQPDWVYAVCGKSGDSTFEGIYKSTNQGVSFTVGTNTPNMFGYATLGDDGAGQSDYDMAIAVNPADANEVVIGGINVWRSTNGGTSFTIITQWTFPNPIGYTHADIHDLAYFGNNLYCGSDGGVFISVNNGDDWTNLSNGLSIMQFYDIAGTPQDENLWIGGAQDNGTNIYGGTTTWTHVLGADGMNCLIDPTNQNVMYGAIQNGDIRKTTNGGTSFFQIVQPDDFAGEAGNWVTPYSLDPNDPNTIFVGYREVYKSTNGGTSWNPISAFGLASPTSNNLEVAPSNSNYIYLSKGPTLYRTTNGGTNWFDISAGLPNLTLTDIAIDPTDPDRVWVSFSGYTAGSKIYQTVNGGTTWTNISGNLPNLPANCVAFQPNSNDILFVGMDVGVYTKNATQMDWTDCSTGLPNVIIREIEINTGVGKIQLGSYGRGAWQMDIPTGGVLTNPSECGLTLDIPDNSCDPATHQFSINVENQPGTQLGTDVTLKEVKLIIAHTWTADLDIRLISPNNVTVELSTDNGGAGDNYGDPADATCTSVTNFTMTAGTSITAGTAPFIGSFIPEGDFAGFNDGSNPNGLWRIEICDDAADDVGMLKFIQLVFEGPPACTNLSDPVAGATNVPVNTALTWMPSTGNPTGYRLDVGTAPGGTDILNNFDVGNVTTYDPPGDLPGSAMIYVTIKPYNANGTNQGCLEESFTTAGGVLTNPSACGLTLVIPDNSCAPLTHQFLVNVTTAPGTQLGTDVTLKEARVIIAHTWTEDLDIRLISPNNVTVELSTDNGGSGDNYGDPADATCTSVTNFTMTAGTSITAGTAPFIGNFIPEGDFAGFNDGSNPNGLWKIEICDDAGGDVGMLKFVELEFEGVGGGACVPNLVVTSLPIPAGEYKSQGDLTSSNSSVANGTTVVFKSDLGVILQNDFSVEAGGIFDALIEACTPQAPEGGPSTGNGEAAGKEEGKD